MERSQNYQPPIAKPQAKDSSTKMMVQLTEEEHEQFQLFLKMQQQQRQTVPTSSNSVQQLQFDGEFGRQDMSLPNFQQAINTQNDFQRENTTQAITDQNDKNFQFDWELPRDQWIPENKVRQCIQCNRDFSVFTWKNHCRKCGRIFCSKCINERFFETDGSRILDYQTVQTRRQKNKEQFRATKICVVCEETMRSFDFGRRQKQNLINMKSTFNTQGNRLGGLATSFGNVMDESQSNLESSFISQTTKFKQPTETKEVQPVWMEGNTKSNNRLSQGFGLAAAVAASEIKNQRSANALSGNTRDASIRNYVQMIEAEELKQQTRLPTDLQLISDAYSHRLKEFSHRHISKVVTEQLLASNLSVRKWHKLIFGFVLKAAEQVRPSSRLLNDSLDINQYVKIKIIDWKDSSRSAYVNGVVMTKNLADKRMQNQIAKPSILILRNSLDSGSIEQRTTDLQRVIDEDEHLIKILSSKLEKIKPTLIFVERDVPYKVMCLLREKHKITVVSNLDEKKITKLARMTQTMSAHGITIIDKNFALGKCKTFSVENISKVARENGFLLESHRNMKTLTSEDHYLMTLDGCNSALGCTILISGPPAEHGELKKLKVAIKSMLKLAKNIVQERYFLQMMNVEVPPLPSFDWVLSPEAPEHTNQQLTEFQEYMSKFEETDKVSPFLITHFIENRSMLVYQEFLISLKTDQNLFSADMEYLPETDDSKINEKFVYSKIDKICGHPIKQKVVFYQEVFDDEGNPNESNDLTLGKYLEQILQKSKKQCSECSNSISQHAVEVYHLTGNIRITIKLTNETQGERKLGWKDRDKDASPQRQSLQQYSQNLDLMTGLTQQGQILFYSHCNTCGQISQQQNLPSQVYELSTARFLEQFFYNEKLQSRNNSCGHTKNLMRDQKLVFQLSTSQKIVFEYIPVDVYKIQLVQPKKHSNRVALQALVERQQEKICVSISKIFEQGKEQIIATKQQMQPILVLVESLAAQDTPFAILSDKLIRVEEVIQKFDQHFSLMINDAMKELTQMKDEVLNALFLKRKVFINLISFQRLFSEVIKLSALLIILCKRRLIVLDNIQILREQKQPLQKQEQTEFEISVLVSESQKVYNENTDLTEESLLQGDRSPRNTSPEPNDLSKQMKEFEDPAYLMKSQNDVATKRKFSKYNTQSQGLEVVNNVFLSSHTQSQNRSKLGLNTAAYPRTDLDQNLKSDPTLKSEAQNSCNCFVEQLFLPRQLTMPPELVRQSFSQRKFRNNLTSFAEADQQVNQKQSYTCPISYCTSQHCQNANFIVQAYKQICDEVQEQIQLIQSGFKSTSNLQEEIQKLDFNDSSFEQEKEITVVNNISLAPHNTTQNIVVMDSSFNFNQSDITQVINKTVGGSVLGFQKKQKLSKKESYNLNWIKDLMEPTLMMPLGMDNNFIQIDQNDISSIIAFALNSNSYCEALGKLDYMNMADKIKKGKDKKGLKTEMEQMILLDKEDVFNYESINRAAIEGEMLNSTKVEFKFRFSTHQKDVNCTIKDGRQEQELPCASFHFKTGKTSQAPAGHHSGIKKVLRDLQTLVMPNINKEYLKNESVKECLSSLESIFSEISNFYLDKETQTRLKNHIAFLNNQQKLQLQNMLTPDAVKNMDFTSDQEEKELEYNQKSSSQYNSRSTLGQNNDNFLVSLQNLGISSAPSQNKQQAYTAKRNAQIAFSSMGMTQIARNIGGAENSQALLNEAKLQIEPGTAFSIESPSKQFYNEQTKGHLGLCDYLKIPKVDFQVKILYPKRFQAMRRFYCGTHQDFLSSIIQSQTWAATGGRTSAEFFKSHDEKYVFKEVKKSEFKMFVEFGPAYFDYMCKAFFHNYPCALAKILGAYVVTTKHHDETQTSIKKYILILENLNLGIKLADEKNIVRYDLKGSELNRFIKDTYNQSEGQSTVLQDSNFLLQMNGRPLVMQKRLANLLQICLNNDSLFLSKQNRIDYSLLTIIDKKHKRIRFGIIDYLQIYTFDRLIETTFKKVVNLGIRPTIIEPKAYRMRFTYFARLYLTGIHSQQERKLPKNATGEDLRQSIALGQKEMEEIEKQDDEVEQSYQGVFVLPVSNSQK